MKTMFLKTFVVVTMVMSSFCVKAQISKGMKLLNGNLSFSTGNYERSDTLSKGKGMSRNISVAPGFGYFISDRICIGLSVPFSYQLSKYSVDNEIEYQRESTNKSMSYGVNPFARYYIPFSEKFYGYLNLGAGVNLTKNSTSSLSNSTVVTENSGYSISSGINFGLTYFVSPKLALETSLIGIRYSMDHSERTDVSFDNGTNSNSLSVNYLGSGLSLGASYYFK